MQYAYRELATPSMVRLVAAVSFTLMALVSLLGPMNTVQTLTLIQRVVFVGVITVIEVPICFACGLFVRWSQSVGQLKG